MMQVIQDIIMKIGDATGEYDAHLDVYYDERGECFVASIKSSDGEVVTEEHDWESKLQKVGDTLDGAIYNLHQQICEDQNI